VASKPRKLCAIHGCGRLTGGRYCEGHAAEAVEQAKASDRRRGSAASRGYGRKWEKARALFLAEHPLCAEHERRGETVAAGEVDHIVPHRGDLELFWDEGNWQSLCGPCHKAKTAREDGGFGNRRPGPSRP
jgi:5-methylcytosine-specific restriction protein A